MMGVGSVGDYLSAYENCNTYITRDGGRTWKEARVGPHLYEFGDQGALAVMVNNKDPTNHVRYSWDEGNTWTQFAFTTDAIRVLGLETVPDSTSLKLMLYGSLVPLANQEADDVDYVTFVLDFSGLGVRQCQLLF